MADEKKSRRGHNRGGKYKGNGYYIEALSLGYTTNAAGKRVRARKYFYGKTRREAEEKKNEWLRAKARDDQLRAKGIDVDRHRIPFAQFVDEWLATSVTGVVKSSTEQSYQHMLRNHLLPAFGDVPLNEITTQAIERMLRDKQRDLKSSSLKTLLTLLRTILNTAVRWRYLERSPATDVRFDFSTAGGARRHITREQEEALFAQDMARWERNLYRLAIDTGMRQGELLALRWSDINLERGVILVSRTLTRSPVRRDDAGDRIGGGMEFTTPKTKAGVRIVPFPDSVRVALIDQRDYLDQVRQSAGKWVDTDLVFPTRNGKPRDPSGVTKKFKLRREAAGITDAVFHSLRHTATSRMMLDNVSHPVAMAILGHKNIDTTMLYTHTTEDDLIEAMQAYFGAKSTEPEG